jgi:membrane-bound lytic murein transglycosylase B
MSWDDDSYADDFGERHADRAPATVRQIVARVAGYVGLVVGVIALIAGAIYVSGVVGLAAKPGGFAAPPAHGPRVAMPPMAAAPLEEDETAPPVPTAEPGAQTSVPLDRIDEPVAVTSEEMGPIDPGWTARTAEATGIPQRALAAYAFAHAAIAEVEPDCGVNWVTIAAIGSIESRHGSHGDSALDETGVVTPGIIGPALDGDGFAAIEDTDDGLLDGDPVWDRAVGPMQFIPSTWARWASDATGDGIADPQQIDDAAVTTARYLCASGPMTSSEGWRAAVYSYNHDDDYVDAVARVANEYAAAIG